MDQPFTLKEIYAPVLSGPWGRPFKVNSPFLMLWKRLWKGRKPDFHNVLWKKNHEFCTQSTSFQFPFLKTCKNLLNCEEILLKFVKCYFNTTKHALLIFSKCFAKYGTIVYYFLVNDCIDWVAVVIVRFLQNLVSFGHLGRNKPKVLTNWLQNQIF